ncbi:hypothetical protein EA772_01290 [Pedobacter sp. G11]|uniref:hypothetical protein n=1 Tax=Pedobacter sp. G11 TaxID=2482728 RepID=UPI000F5E9826|nr:hypothetical protein [Pedobacter sp. G11]AZI24042.1 hypothetical protein EA772_01290 [Pedobacter sp. G11]
MYKLISILILCTGLSSQAQNTYPFPSSGNLGIGTTSPIARLNVSGTFVVTGANLDKNGVEANLNYLLGDGKCLIGWNRSGGMGESDFITSQGPGGSGGFSFIQYNSDGTERELMYMRGNGNIGIGITNPAEKLAVNGNIRAKEVKVETNNWPDYVFKANYSLLPLNQTEKYINLNGHLPDLPSALVVEKEGVSLGEMNKLLLKKIEELTLHLIAQDKRIDELSATIQLIRKPLVIK